MAGFLQPGPAMAVSATKAKNHPGQMLVLCQREPVVIEKSGWRHRVLISPACHDAPLLPAAHLLAVLPQSVPQTPVAKLRAENHRIVDALHAVVSGV